MIFILPIGHEQDELRRWPFVSFAIVGLCVLAFLGTLLFEGNAEKKALQKARAVFDFHADKPYLEIDEDLLFGDTASLAEESWAETGWIPPRQKPDEDQIRHEQEALDELTSEWRRASDAAPYRVFGLIPADRNARSFVTHIFIHAGWLHLLGNLFFFWLAGPPLEDVWGRPLYAIFFLAAGVVAGLLWVSRYPNSTVAVIGASGAIAGLMGAFMVRFWRVRIRFIFATWLSLHIYSGSFTAPAWLMLSLWLVRELVFGSYFEPHAMVSGGVATWAHIFGFGFGALAALAIRASRIEERWVRPKVVAATGELHNAILDQASDLLERERYDEAWELLRKELATQPKNGDAIILWWDLASRLGRQLEVAPHLLRKIRHDLQKGEFDVAWQYWLELREQAPGLEIPPELKVRLAEAILEAGGPRSEIAGLLASARAGIGASPPIGILVRMARTSARAEIPGAASLCSRIAEDQRAPETIRQELRELGEQARLASQIWKPTPFKGEES